MKELLFFKQEYCPYCRAAERWIAELSAENPDYSRINIRRIDENVESELADSYDYYYVPTFFLDGAKLHEGGASREIIRGVLDRALAEE